jgi:hypothetical protein
VTGLCQVGISWSLEALDTKRQGMPDEQQFHRSPDR